MYYNNNPFDTNIMIKYNNDNDNYEDNNDRNIT